MIVHITHLLVEMVFAARVIKTMVPLPKRLAPCTRSTHGGSESGLGARPRQRRLFRLSVNAICGALAVLGPLGACSSVGHRQLVAIILATADASATPRKA